MRKKRTTIEKLNDIFLNGYGRIRFSCGGSITCDSFTAGAIITVYNAIKEENKVKMDERLKTKAGFMQMAQFSMKNVSVKK